MAFPELHPVLSGFPSGFVLLLLAVECMARTRYCVAIKEPLLSTTRYVCIAAIVVSTAAAFLSGYQASYLAGEIKDADMQLLSLHHAMGRLLLINACLLGVFFWLSRVAKRGGLVCAWCYLACLILQTGIAFYTGLQGGRLVFERGIGVKVMAVESPLASKDPHLSLQETSRDET
jgi:uncharacterized membrane protein